MHAATRDTELTELLEEVHRIDAMSAQLVTDVMAGGYSSVFKGFGIEFDEVREYMPGDDPRSVDWNVTARVGTPYIKKFVDERELTVLFLLDLSASMDGGFGAWSQRQMAARLCACLALSAIKNDDNVGLVAFSQEVDKYVPARKGVRHVLRIVRDCLALRGSSTGTSLLPVLEFVARVRRRRTVVFLLSDFMTDGWQRPLLLCAKRHDLIAVRLGAPELLPLPVSAGLCRLRDPESGAATLVDWGSAAARRGYAERVARWQADTLRDLRRAGVDVIDAPLPRERDPDAVSRPILEFFRMRARREAHR